MNKEKRKTVAGTMFEDLADDLIMRGAKWEDIARALSDTHSKGYTFANAAWKRDVRALCLAELILERHGLYEEYLNMLKDELVRGLHVGRRKCSKKECTNSYTWDGRCPEHQGD